MRKILFIIAGMFLALGLGVLCFDAYTYHDWGFHLNEVAGVTDDGQPIDWPTGERPSFTFIPLSVYGMTFCLAAVALFSLMSHVGRVYHVRVWRGDRMKVEGEQNDI